MTCGASESHKKHELPGVIMGQLSGSENGFRIESVTEWVCEVPQSVVEWHSPSRQCLGMWFQCRL